MKQLSSLRLLQLASPSLPIGAFAYSQGLESAVQQDYVNNFDTACRWVHDLLEQALEHLDLPIFLRCYDAWTCQDEERAIYWSAYLIASRETRELREEERQLGQALARILYNLDMTQAGAWRRDSQTSYAALFALAAVSWDIPQEESAAAFLWTWLENQVAAAIKLVPLGQTEGQRILFEVSEKIPACVERASLKTDSAIGASLPGFSILSAQHEIQYSRLFRS